MMSAPRQAPPTTPGPTTQGRSMRRWGALVVRRRWWVIGIWVVLAAAGAYSAPKATAALSYDFSLPGKSGYLANQEILQRFSSGGDNAPVVVVVGDGHAPVDGRAGAAVETAVRQAVPQARTVGFADDAVLLSKDARTGVVLVYPPVLPGASAYPVSLPALQQVAATLSAGGTPVAVTGVDALAADSGGDSGAGVLVEVLFGGVGALIVLLLVFGSGLALMPLIVAAASILTTFGIVWALTGITDVSFIVQYLLSLIGLGVAIDYALLIVTRWREERGRGATDSDAVVQALGTAGRSVLFSGITVAVSLAALIALPVPFLRSVGFTGLLIPIVSVATSLSLLPALLAVIGRRLDWPHRRRADPDSRLWRRIGTFVVRRRFLAAGAAVVVLLALAAPVLGLRLGQPTNASSASVGGAAGTAVLRLDTPGLGSGLTQPAEILTTAPDRVAAAVRGLAGVGGVLAPAAWAAGGQSVVDVWSIADASSTAGAHTLEAVRSAATAAGGQVGGQPAQDDADFISAVYGNAWLIVAIIVIVTFALLARALRSVVLPLKALVLNVISIAAAYGATVLIWQDGFATRLLFDQRPAGAIVTWVPIAAFAFLFGLSMDYEVFLLSRIREEYDLGADTDTATVDGVARTGRLVSSAALILFLAFVALSRVPSTDVKELATTLALGIIIDATIVRGVLAPALVAALGPANWWTLTRATRRRQPKAGQP